MCHFIGIHAHGAGIPPKQSTHFLFSNVRTLLNPYVLYCDTPPPPKARNPMGMYGHWVIFPDHIRLKLYPLLCTHDRYSSEARGKFKQY